MHGAGENLLHQTCPKIYKFFFGHFGQTQGRARRLFVMKSGNVFALQMSNSKFTAQAPPPQILQSAVLGTTGCGLAAMVSDNVT